MKLLKIFVTLTLMSFYSVVFAQELTVTYPADWDTYPEDGFTLMAYAEGFSYDQELMIRIAVNADVLEFYCDEEHMNGSTFEIDLHGPGQRICPFTTGKRIPIVATIKPTHLVGDCSELVVNIQNHDGSEAVWKEVTICPEWID